ncbi:hypothetical protein H7I76_10975 [Mycolicibacterium vaccae]|nr:hypothetical protein [Mycolicibacterium vaccae]
MLASKARIRQPVTQRTRRPAIVVVVFLDLFERHGGVVVAPSERSAQNRAYWVIESAAV